MENKKKLIIEIDPLEKIQEIAKMENKKQLIIELATARAIQSKIEDMMDIEEFYNRYENYIDQALLETVKEIKIIQERLKNEKRR